MLAKSSSLLGQYLVKGSMRFISRSNPHIYRAKREMYPCIPATQHLTPKDPFDYKLRSKEEVLDEFKYMPPHFFVDTQYKRYTAGDVRPGEDNYDNRERVAKIRLDIRDLRLAPLQRDRLEYLLGPRFNKKNGNTIKIVYGQYNTFGENYIRCFETMRELYWEAKRAPSHNHTMVVNPYRREKLIKSFYGKYKEDRKQKIKMLNKMNKEHRAAVDEQMMEQELAESKKQEQISNKRRAYSQRRRDLGFKNVPEEMDDPVLDVYAVKDAKY
jgi:hypothetical protein